MKRQRQRETKNQKPTTKIEPLQGSLEARYVRCGRSNCKCAKGELHGPYYLRRWQRYGKRRSKYVKKHEISATFEACLAFKRDRQETREIIRSINNAGNTILQAMREMLRGS
jgi:hypothetical protein